MKRALCLFTFAAALSTSAFAAPAPTAPACPAEAAAVVFAADSGEKNPNCPRTDVLCPAIYDPVICSSTGQVYGNSCLAYVNCAHGCKPYEDAV